MQFLKNLKAKISQRLERPIFSNVQTIPEKDVALLAVMCRMCRPVTVRKYILAHIYAYYIPQLESDIYIAQKIFEKNGIRMDVHFSHIIDNVGQNVLRTDYGLCADKDKLLHGMKRIEQKFYSLYTPEAKEEKIKLWNQVIELRTKQK